jgi:L-ascorbate metabolism protein UlaG (beta-lactamase superfamily)
MFKLTLVGGPTAVLEYAGLRWLTDPSLSPPGEYAGGLVKTTGPAIEIDAIGAIDVVLLSHDQHSDNLDPAGRDFLPRAGRVLTTTAGAERLGGNATGIEPWASVRIERDGDPVTVTAVPAQHGPDGCEPVTGPVIGFVLEAPGEDKVYVSGDNASLDVVRAIADRLGPV